MPIVTVLFNIETDGSGDFTETKSERLNNRLLYAVEWVDGDMVDGVDFVLSVVNSPSGVDYAVYTKTDANDDAFDYPRAPTVDLAGAVGVSEDYPILDGKLKLAVSDGGASKIGKCLVRYLVI